MESCSSLLYRHLHQKRKSRGNSGDNLKSFLCFKTIALSSTEKEGRISLKFKGLLKGHNPYYYGRIPAEQLDPPTQYGISYELQFFGSFQCKPQHWTSVFDKDRGALSAS